MHLMFDLQLESYHVGPLQSRITDSIMLDIKESSRPVAGRQPINPNSFGKVNKSFCRFVIDFLAVQLVFNNGASFQAQVAPSPYTRDYNNPEVMRLVRQNQALLIWLAIQMQPIKAQSLLCDIGQLGWESPNLKQIFSQANSYCVKRRQGILSSYHGYSDNDNAKCLWIHHWVILQMIHPYFRVGLGEDISNEGYVVFKHDNWNQCISQFDEAANQNYAEVHGDAPRFGLLWLGRRGPVLS